MSKDKEKRNEERKIKSEYTSCKMFLVISKIYLIDVQFQYNVLKTLIFNVLYLIDNNIFWIGMPHVYIQIK